MLWTSRVIALTLLFHALNGSMLIRPCQGNLAGNRIILGRAVLYFGFHNSHERFNVAAIEFRKAFHAAILGLITVDTLESGISEAEHACHMKAIDKFEWYSPNARIRAFGFAIENYPYNYHNQEKRSRTQLLESINPSIRFSRRT